ncbi:MAG: gamma-glutamylcyclotransferase [Proteobacteria bacterium]|nr:MAG: gamma-glutamylcyclotransferase [Pseudomonadota bacterium]
MRSAFFYGLFMDRDLLKDKGLCPVGGEIARVTGYGLRIGERATLERSANERVFGVVIRLSRDELQRLYCAEEVVDYIPRQLLATGMCGNPIDVVSYVLPVERASGRNSEYAKALARVARKVELPLEYINEIESWI